SRSVPSERIVEFIDLYPTVADLAGLKPPRDLPGVSLRPLLDDPHLEWERPAFTQILRPGEPEHIMGRVISTARYRYIEWGGGEQGRELYDVVNDPQEVTNLANEPELQTVVKRLSQLFREHAAGAAPTAPVNPKRL
ncbi:MAG: DUF4976 domain-containing protein, partial [Planctomycetaceae bacterium]|nr:DUF4976 domain-containing protein [Planctomycetaceae bacterium]